MGLACLGVEPSLQRLVSRVGPDAFPNMVPQRSPGIGVRRVAANDGREMGVLFAAQPPPAAPASHPHVPLDRVSSRITPAVVLTQQNLAPGLGLEPGHLGGAQSALAFVKLTDESPRTGVSGIDPEGFDKLGVMLLDQVACFAPKRQSHVCFGVASCLHRGGSIEIQVTGTGPRMTIAGSQDGQEKRRLYERHGCAPERLRCHAER
jgi:uncharacterized protein YodC (DUF2158 family)